MFTEPTLKVSSPVIDFVKKNTWIVLVAAFVVLVVAGIMMS